MPPVNSQTSVEVKPRKIFRLKDVTSRLRAILLEASAKQFWVRAQFIPDRGAKRTGHCYGNLVEVDPSGRTVAKMRAVIWEADFERIQETLRAQGQADALAGNREICACCAVRFHEVHGLSLKILDVDPTFGESHIDRNRRLIIETLRREGLLEKNRALAIPTAPLRIGLVTAPTSAAFADFQKTLVSSAYGFKVLLASTAMQGERTAREVVAAVHYLARLRVDLICMVRGGGSPIDLAWLDDESIARAIAHSAVPVWVGIGHEIDRGVPDVVAHTSYKTPTALGEALVARIQSLDERLQAARELLPDACERRMDLAHRHVQQQANGLVQGSRKHVQIHVERFKGYVARLEGALAERTAGHLSLLSQRRTQLRERIRGVLHQVAKDHEHAWSRLLDRTPRCVELAESSLTKNLVGLVQGVRKHYTWFGERYKQRWVRFQGLIDRSLDQRLGLLTTDSVRLRERTRALLEYEALGLAEAATSLAKTARGRFAAGVQGLGRRSDRMRIAQRTVRSAQTAFQVKIARFTPEYFERKLLVAEESLEEKGKRLELLKPERLLDRGYSLTRDASGRIIRSVAEVAVNETIHTLLRDGALTSVVTSIEDQSNGPRDTQADDLRTEGTTTRRDSVATG